MALQWASANKARSRNRSTPPAGVSSASPGQI